MNSPNSDIPVEQIVAMVLGDLDSSQAAALEADLTRTPEARRLLHNIRDLVRTLQTDDGVSPPGELVRRVKGLIAAPSHATPRPSLREVAAALVFDSFGKVAVAGFRGTIADRQLAYSSDAADVDLQIASPDESRRVYRGQVSPAPSAGEVTLARPGSSEPISSSPVDARGMFSLESPPGTFDLRVRVGDTVVLLPTLGVE